MTLGEKMSQLRKNNRYTQDEVAEKLGVTPQAVSKWENNASCPDIMLLTSIAELYGVTTDELLDRRIAPIASIIPSEYRKPLDEMMLRVLVNSDEANVKINLPMSLVKVMLESGATPPDFSAGNFNLSNVDWNQIIDLVERGVVGQLVEIEADGGKVTVIIEVA